MQKITKWLQSEKDWETGVALYQTYGQNKHLLRQLVNIGETPTLRLHLEYQLTTIAKVEPPTPAEKPKPKPKPVLQAPVQHPTQQQPPAATNQHPDIAEAYAARASRTNDRAKLSNSLRNFATDDVAGRQEVCVSIEVLSKQIYQYTETIRYFEQYKQLPPAAPAPETPQFALPEKEAEQLKLLHNLRSQRSKMKKKIEALPQSHPDTISLQEKLATIVRNIENLEKAIAPA